MSEALVEAIGLVRHYKLPGKRLLRAVDGVDLAIGRGGALGLVGESGSGKSTLGRTLVGLQNPSAGEVRFEGETVVGASGAKLVRLRRQRQIVFQDPSGALNPRITSRRYDRRASARSGLGARESPRAGGRGSDPGRPIRGVFGPLSA